MVQDGCADEQSNNIRVADEYLRPKKTWVATPSNLAETLAVLKQHKRFGFDTETTGLSRKDRLFSAIVACAAGSFYFSYKDYGDGSPFFSPKDIPEHFQWMFDQAEAIFISNAKYDMYMAGCEGIVFSQDNVICTHVQGRILRNNMLSYSLESQARALGLEKDGGVDEYIKEHKLYTKVSVPGKDTKEKKPHFDQVPFPIITKYGFQDAWLHYAIGETNDKAITTCTDRSRVYANERKLTRVCFDIERRGIGVNWQYIVSARDWELCQLTRTQREFEVLTNESYEGTKSQLIRLFQESGDTIPLTEKGNPSLKGDVLDTFKSPVAQIEKRIRSHNQRIATYYSSFLHFALTDRIHANIRQAGTETGRFSYADPNLQNLPKDEDSVAPYVVRGCFVPAPGHFFASLDYSQLEYRLMLDYAGEHYLIREIRAGADVHQAMADMVGISRNFAKTLNFAILYGSGIANIADMLGITLREAQELRSLYFGRLPKVGRFIDRVVSVAKSRGYVKNWLGRYCYLPHHTMAYKMPNHLIQGGGADVIKKAMVESRGVFNARSGLVLQVHDELVVEVHENECEKVAELQKYMEAAYTPQNGMELKVDVSFSKSSLAKRELSGDLNAS